MPESKSHKAAKIKRGRGKAKIEVKISGGRRFPFSRVKCNRKGIG